MWNFLHDICVFSKTNYGKNTVLEWWMKLFTGKSWFWLVCLFVGFIAHPVVNSQGYVFWGGVASGYTSLDSMYRRHITIINLHNTSRHLTMQCNWSTFSVWPLSTTLLGNLLSDLRYVSSDYWNIMPSFLSEKEVKILLSKELIQKVKYPSCERNFSRNIKVFLPWKLIVVHWCLGRY